ncbi:MAG: M20 family metallo-hydrolase [Gammaproteobacteria bacterium]|nr:M20 family metallo-hydrolase [Gammaproteobacteria bacterium]MXZ28565.1 M20 family metallo-hydrolase [Gammaproteobacteria bacterium]MYF57912.1 M20 family metallo-hydrolase [Gammaproteobacteria bacterium]
MLPIDPQRMLADLRALAEFGRLGTGVNRRSLTPEDLAARDWLLERMRAAGLDAQIDGIGSVAGRTPGSRKHVLIGSHTDSVPKGGWLDGSMGVIFGLEIARAYVGGGRSDELGIEVISFIDEEGRFAGLLGSAAFTGRVDESDIGKLKDERGEKLESALQAAGYDGRELLRCEPGRHAAYLEAHIEQGPVLETAGRKIGLVTDIVGVARCEVVFTGQADHAGTTPMELRRDAAAALYAFADDFARFCSEEGSDRTVWNLGIVAMDPGAYNVVTRQARLGVEYRDPSDSVIDRIRQYIGESAGRLAKRHRVSTEVVAGASIRPNPMDESLLRHLELAAGDLGASSMRMPSGAGHDATMLAPLIPSAMMFVPSIGGRSHDISEDTREEDIVLGLKVLARAVERIIDSA